ncbi:MAG TPA: hypothetical protein VIG99_24095 [Myxococcaceae bacterium]
MQEEAKEEAKQPPEPEKPKASDAAADLEETLEEGEVVSPSRVMGSRIVASAVKPYIHGVFAVDWRWVEGDEAIPNTLELREAHVYVGAHILDIAQSEVFFELEKKNQTDDPIKLRYGQVDVRVFDELLVLRGGLFLVPFGVYNTELFLRWDAKLPERPDIHRHIVPGSWSEVGVQAHGKWEWSPGRVLQYAAYVTNGQEGSLTPDRATYDPVYRSLSGAKSFGARVTVRPLEGFQVGLSGYHGALNGAGGALILGGLDFIFRRGPFSVDGEAIYGQRMDPGPIPEAGFYAAAGYWVTEAIEPVIGVSGYSLGPTEEEKDLDVQVGVNVRPFAERFPSAMLKAAYNRDFSSRGPAGDNSVTILFVIGF